MSDLRNHWNQSHARIPLNKSVSNYALHCEPKFPAQSDVCDLGGGSGSDAIYFAQKGHRVTIIDISDAALTMSAEKAAKANVQVSLKQADLNVDSLPLVDGSMDIVYSRLALHYFSAQRTAEIFTEIVRALKRGGKAFLTFKSPNDTEEMAYLTSHSQLVEPGVYKDGEKVLSRFTLAQLHKIIKTADVKGEVHEYKESLGNRIDAVKSGKQDFLLNEVYLSR